MKARDKYERTVCACNDCRAPCECMPGHLVPSDIPRLIAWLDKGTPGLSATLGMFLAASPGATIRDRATGETLQVPTIVPNRHPKTGKCAFLMDDGLCAVHEVAPYGCAYFDMHMSREEGDRRVYAGLEEIVRSQSYRDLWCMLAKNGQRAPSPNDGRRALAAALDRTRTRAAAVTN